MALTSDQILNNFMLYRDDTVEMLSVYDRNNIYEEGTQNFSIDKLAAQCPVFIFTGDIPALENTTDKNKTIYVDVEYINMQDPSRSFTGKGIRLRPQGTSSMGYPKRISDPIPDMVRCGITWGMSSLMDCIHLPIVHNPLMCGA